MLSTHSFHYVYCHFRNDTNEVFYVGKGQKKIASKLKGNTNGSGKRDLEVGKRISAGKLGKKYKRKT